MWCVFRRREAWEPADDDAQRKVVICPFARQKGALFRTIKVQPTAKVLGDIASTDDAGAVPLLYRAGGRRRYIHAPVRIARVTMAGLLRGCSVLVVARPAAMRAGLCAMAQRGMSSAADLLGAATLKSGDVVLQNAGDSEAAASVVSAAAAQGVKTVCIVEPTSDFAEVSAKLEGLGALATVTSDYAATWRLGRLLSDLPKPTLGINAADGTNAVDMVKLMGGGGTLVTYGGKLPAQVAYPGSERKPTKWSDYLSEHGVSAKTV